MRARDARAREREREREERAEREEREERDEREEREEREAPRVHAIICNIRTCKASHSPQRRNPVLASLLKK